MGHRGVPAVGATVRGGCSRGVTGEVQAQVDSGGDARAGRRRSARCERRRGERVPLLLVAVPEHLRGSRRGRMTGMTHTPLTPTVRHIGIVLFDDVEELDAVGPWEVLAYWTRTYPDDGYAVLCASSDGQPVTAAQGLTLGAHASLAQARQLEVLIHPGGQGTRRLLRDPDHLDWVREQRKQVTLMTSVCTGALVYAAAGLLHQRPATTHWGAVDELRALDPSIDLRAQDRWVDDGDLVTSAGVSAGIDMALHLVARLAGSERARQVRRGIQYDPQPPV
jgi:transcriptional regulator GlxA family with amidase domain